MPTGKYQKTKEHRRKIGLAHLGKKRVPFSNEWKKNLSLAGIGRIISLESRKKSSESQKGEKNHNYGKKASIETRQKMSNSQKGRIHSKETRLKISKSNIGKKRSKETCIKIGLSKKGKMSGSNNPMFRMISPMKGKHHSIESKLKISLGNKGKTMSKESRIKISISKKGKKGRIHSEETKKKQKEWHVLHPNKKFKDTGIELKIEKELKARKINYIKQCPLVKSVIVDFYLPDINTVIQCDGCFWHNCLIHNPKDHKEKRIRDMNQDILLKSNGFNIYRFWEHEINQSVEDCINKLILK